MTPAQFDLGGVEIELVVERGLYLRESMKVIAKAASPNPRPEGVS